MSKIESWGGAPTPAHWSAAFSREGIEASNEVQEASFAPIAGGLDTVIHSGTGTGKTLAYLLPLLQRAQKDPRFRFLILAPSPELAIQILRVAEAFKAPGTASVGLIGGGNMDRQKERLKKHPPIMVGTPGRVLDLIDMKKVKLHTLNALVLDEADEVLAPRIAPLIEQVCGHKTFSAQLVCASATFGAAANRFADTFMKSDRQKVETSVDPLQHNITHLAFPYQANGRDVALAKLVDRLKVDQGLVFVNRLTHVTHLYRFLNESGLKVGGLSSSGHKGTREQALRDFRSKKTRLLITTDAAAHGIDIKGLKWVIHFEVARNSEIYRHRAGRTGRGDGQGTSVVMASSAEAHLLRQYAKKLQIDFQWAPNS